MDHRRLIATAALPLALAACAGAPPQPFDAGKPVPAPAGWQEYCRQAPADSACRPGETR